MYYVGEPSAGPQAGPHHLRSHARRHHGRQAGRHAGRHRHAIQTVAHREHFSIVRVLATASARSTRRAAGAATARRGPVLPGMMFTIEPMINAGKPATRQMPDGWTVVTKDRSLSAQWEHMVVVTDTGYEVLTPWPTASATIRPSLRRLPGSASGVPRRTAAAMMASPPSWPHAARQDGSVQCTGCHRLHALTVSGVPPTGLVQPGRPILRTDRPGRALAVLALGADAARPAICRPPRPCPSCCCRCPPACWPTACSAGC